MDTLFTFELSSSVLMTFKFRNGVFATKFYKNIQTLFYFPRNRIKIYEKICKQLISQSYTLY